MGLEQLSLTGTSQEQKEKPPTYTELTDAVLALQDELARQNEELTYYKQAVQVDPWKQGGGIQNANERFADRMLKQRIGDTNRSSGCELWLIWSDVVEILALLNITKREYQKFVRDWADIEDLAQGEGNEEIVRAKLEEMYFALQLYRSRGDNPLSSYTERTELTTNRTSIGQEVRMPAVAQRTQQVGFFDVLRRKQQ